MFLNQKRPSPILSKDAIKDSKSETFLLKLYQILQNKKYAKFIHWSTDGNSVVISNISELTNRVLPKYFKHRNYASFVRQLNMYNFHKVRNNQSQNEQIFYHEQFVKNQNFDSIQSIKRKIKEKINSPTIDDELQIQEFINEINNKSVSKSTIQHMVVFLLGKTKENLRHQKELNMKIEELKKKNESLIQMMTHSVINSQNDVMKKMKAVALFIMTLVMNHSNKMMHKEENPLKALVYKYVDYHDSQIKYKIQSPTVSIDFNTTNIQESRNVLTLKSNKSNIFEKDFPIENTNNIFDIDLDLNFQCHSSSFQLTEC